MVVSDDAENLAVDGGVAAKAGEAWASAKVDVYKRQALPSARTSPALPDACATVGPRVGMVAATLHRDSDEGGIMAAKGTEKVKRCV